MTTSGTKPKMDVTEDQAKVLIGKRLLVGVAHCKADGSVISREQFHGIVTRTTLSEGVVIKLNGSNDERAVPLKLSCLQIARPGEYRLTNSDEVVVDPDYTLKVTLAD